MNRSIPTKLILILFILLLGALILMVTFLTLSGTDRTRKQQESPVAPTLFQQKEPGAKQITPLPTTQMPTGIIPPAQFTGAEEPQLPKDELSLIEQKAKLRKSTPLSLPFGKVTFDFSEDMFVVELNEEKASSQKLFEQWRVGNYSQIPQDRFIFR